MLPGILVTRGFLCNRSPVLIANLTRLLVLVVIYCLIQRILPCFMVCLPGGWKGGGSIPPDRLFSASYFVEWNSM